jgi:hypothetical protein
VIIVQKKWIDNESQSESAESFKNYATDPNILSISTGF